MMVVLSGKAINIKKKALQIGSNGDPVDESLQQGPKNFAELLFEARRTKTLTDSDKTALVTLILSTHDMALIHELADYNMAKLMSVAKDEVIKAILDHIHNSMAAHSSGKDGKARVQVRLITKKPSSEMAKPGETHPETAETAPTKDPISDFEVLTEFLKEHKHLLVPNHDRLNTLGPGQVLSEISLFHDVPQLATMICIEDVQMATLSKEKFHFFFSGKALEDSHIRSFLQFYIPIPADSVEVLKKWFVLKTFVKNQHLYREASPIEYVYLIQSGDVEITQRLKIVQAGNNQGILSKEETNSQLQIPRSEQMNMSLKRVSEGKFLGVYSYPLVVAQMNLTSAFVVSSEARIFCLEWKRFVDITITNPQVQEFVKNTIENDRKTWILPSNGPVTARRSSILKNRIATFTSGDKEVQQALRNSLQSRVHNQDQNKPESISFRAKIGTDHSLKKSNPNKEDNDPLQQRRDHIFKLFSGSFSTERLKTEAISKRLEDGVVSVYCREGISFKPSARLLSKKPKYVKPSPGPDGVPLVDGSPRSYKKVPETQQKDEDANISVVPLGLNMLDASSPKARLAAARFSHSQSLFMRKSTDQYVTGHDPDTSPRTLDGSRDQSTMFAKNRANSGVGGGFGRPDTRLSVDRLAPEASVPLDRSFCVC